MGRCHWEKLLKAIRAVQDHISQMREFIREPNKCLPMWNASLIDKFGGNRRKEMRDARFSFLFSLFWEIEQVND